MINQSLVISDSIQCLSREDSAPARAIGSPRNLSLITVIAATHNAKLNGIRKSPLIKTDLMALALLRRLGFDRPRTWSVLS